MPDATDALFTALIAVTVCMTAFAIGLETSPASIRATVKRPLVVAVGANLVLVPLIGYGVVHLLPVGLEHGTGILLCAMCVGGPLGLKVTQIARGDLAWALALTVVLLPLNVITVPLWSSVLLDRSLTVRPGDLFGAMLVVVLAPAFAGAMVRRIRSVSGARWAEWATLSANVLLVGAVVAGVVGNASELAAGLSSWVVLAALAVVAGSGLVGGVVPVTPRLRHPSMLITINRATSVALLVVGRAFSTNAGVFSAVLVFGVVQTATALGVSLIMSRRGERTSARPRDLTR